MLHRQFPLVMVAHASYPEVTKNNQPASLSRKWMQQILRDRIGYRGLIISDDLEMGGVLAAGSIEDVAVETLRAGGVTELRELEIPHGPCARFDGPAGRIAVYQLARPDVAESFSGRLDP